MFIERRDHVDDRQVEEFEKLEFLPEEPINDENDPEISSEIVFDPDSQPSEEPPVSYFSNVELEPVEEGELEFSNPPSIDFEPDTNTPFELVGTSLFEADSVDDEFSPYDFDDLDEDLEF